MYTQCEHVLKSVLLTRRMAKVYQSLTAWILVPVWVLLLQVPPGSTEGVNCNTTVETSDGQNLCIWLESEPSTWQKADEQCSKNGGFLLPVTSSTVNDVIQRLMVDNQLRTIWLGLHEEFSTWRWLSDGREVTHQGCFHDNPRRRDREVSTVLGENNTYEACIDHCLGLNYRYAGVQARTKCWCRNSFGRHGHSIHCDLLCPTTNTQICGGSNASVVLVSQGVYSDWQNGQPNNHQFYQTCATIDSYKDEYQWNDLKCTERSGVVCEIELNETECVSRSYLYDSTWGCFIVNNESLSFFRSREFCHRNGGRILTLQSRQKRDFFVRHLKSNNYRPTNFYIGLVRGRWRWVTGEDLIYSSWENGRPNGAKQGCTTMSVEGFWNDVGCQGQFRYFCLKDPLSPRTTPPPATTRTTTSSGSKDLTTHIQVYRKGFTKWEIIKYSLIGGGTFFGFVLIMVAVCAITFRARKKKATNRYDYFYGQEEKPQLNGEVNGDVKELPDDDISINGEWCLREVQAPDMESLKVRGSASGEGPLYIDKFRERYSVLSDSRKLHVTHEHSTRGSNDDLSVAVPVPVVEPCADIGGSYVTVIGEGKASTIDVEEVESLGADSETFTDRNSLKDTKSEHEESPEGQSMEKSLRADSEIFTDKNSLKDTKSETEGTSEGQSMEKSLRADSEIFTDKTSLKDTKSETEETSEGQSMEETNISVTQGGI